MPRQKEEWITAQEAAAILTGNTDHEVSADYVRMLAKSGKIEARDKNLREKEYLKSDAQAYRVRLKNAPRVRPRPSTRKEVAS
ncbi:MAG: hypothetical protein ACJ788_03185 [Ktedonobacteraceae bacterium]